MATAAVPIEDPYAEKPSFWRENATWVWTVAVFALTAALTIFSFPPYTAAEFGYAFAVPAIFWAYLEPSFKRSSRTSLS